MEGKPKFQPKPKMPFPAPELYDKLSEGEAPLEGEMGRGIENDAVPLTAFTENFSSIPLIAPPPFGREIEGISIEFDFVLPPSVFRNRDGCDLDSLLEESEDFSPELACIL